MYVVSSIHQVTKTLLNISSISFSSQITAVWDTCKACQLLLGHEHYVNLYQYGQVMGLQLGIEVSLETLVHDLALLNAAD